MEAVDVRSQAEAQVVEARRAAEDYQRITASFPVTQTTTENLRVTVAEFTRIASHTGSPEAAFAHVSRVLEGFPQFELDRIDFSVEKADPSQRLPGTPGSEGLPPGTPAAPGARSEAPGDAVLRLEIFGRVNAMERNDYRGITEQVRRFAAALGTSGYQLARTQLPFDVTSEGTLTGDIGAGAGSGEAPRFTVAVLRKLP
jgi:hypothetical protein